MKTCLALVLLLLANVARADDVVRIGWLRGTNDLTLSKARGTLEAALAPLHARVDWAGPFPASAPAVEAMNANAIDITVGATTSAVFSLAGHAPVSIFAYQRMGADAEAILVKADGPIRSIADLAGHSVAVNRGGTGEYLLTRALATHGIDSASVRRVYLSPADAGPAFAAGAVDAMTAWDPFLSISIGLYKARVLANGPQIGSENAIVMIARRGFADEHPALLRTVFDTLLADNRWSVAHPAEAGVIWAQALGVPDALAAEFGTRDAVPTVAVGPDQQAQFRRIADWYVTAGIIPERPMLDGSVVDFSR